MEGLQSVKKCRYSHLNAFAIENIMELLNGILEDYKGNVEIYNFTKKRYLYVLNDINSMYKNNVINEIGKAKEITPKPKRTNTIEPILDAEIDQICK